MTKQQLYDGLLEQGLDQESIDAVKNATASMSEELSQDDLKVIMELIDEMEKVEKILERSYEQEIDANLDAHDEIMNAADDYIESAARQTIDDINLVNSLVGKD